MENVVECVPNISEGQNSETISAIGDLLSTLEGITFLHTDPNPDANRTVFTFAGNIANVAKAALALFQLVTQKVDMRSHRGEHVRNGALDVCPFIPVRGVTAAECVAAAKDVGEAIGRLGYPVYLYGMAATTDRRRELSWLRKGQYESLPQRLQQPQWKPDFGPSCWSDKVARVGSVQIGVRPFLIAYNVNLKTRNVEIAKHIARLIRTSGYQGTPGEFSNLKADGWWMASYGCAQITMNITDFHTTPLHLVYQRIAELAQEWETDTDGSELIGLIPLEALKTAGKYYCGQAAQPNEILDDGALIEAAVNGLGLQRNGAFDARQRIFEYRMADASKSDWQP